MLRKIRRRLLQEWPSLYKNVLEVNDIGCLKTALGCEGDPVLEGEYLHDYEDYVDLNNRRLRDAEVVGVACHANRPGIILEIGTAYGHMTYILARNAPDSAIYTVNIPPEEIDKGGKRTTIALNRDAIGRYYREQGCSNIKQIFANTASWEPDFGPIDIAFIDGCHDADFVFNDTRKVLAKSRPGTIIMWHDFSLRHARSFGWISEVCTGVERLFRKRLIRGKILHVKDSWVGLYRVPEAKK